MKDKLCIILLFIVTTFTSCRYDHVEPVPLDPDLAEEASVDRFSSDAGTLFVRDATNGLPIADEPIDFDQGPFITKGLGPNGEKVQYYNFDVMPIRSAPIYVFFKPGEDTPVSGQLNVVDVKPGDGAYSDFWHVHKITVSTDYVANAITSLQKILDSGYPIERTNLIVNCPIVPAGSIATKRYKPENGNGLIRGWYKNKIVYYFDFSEKTLTATLPPEGYLNVPLSGILVTFNINPGIDGGGPPSGFVTETGTNQTHNVVETLPEDTDYSPFWSVSIYNNADFNSVNDWVSASNANILASGAAFVNCPVVVVE